MTFKEWNASAQNQLRPLHKWSYEDVVWEREQAWNAAAEHTQREQEVLRWKKAIEGLTPSGSEFVDDPEACAAYIRNRWTSSHERLVATTKALHAREQEVSKLVAKWRMQTTVGMWSPGAARCVRECADELEAALAPFLWPGGKGGHGGTVIAFRAIFIKCMVCGDGCPYSVDAENRFRQEHAARGHHRYGVQYLNEATGFYALQEDFSEVTPAVPEPKGNV